MMKPEVAAEAVVTVTKVAPVTADIIAPTVVFPTVVAPVVLGDKTATLVHYFSWPVVTMLVVLIVAALMLWNAQKSKLHFDMKDLVMDHDSNRVSLSKFANLTALMVSSWGMIALVVGGAMTEGYMLAFMGIWSGNALGTQFIKTRDREASASIITAHNSGMGSVEDASHPK